MKELSFIFEQASLSFPLVLGSFISFSLLRVPDLSVETAYVFGASISAQALVGGLGFPAAIVGAMCGGLLVGFLSSAITQYAGLPHLLSSILVMGLFHGVLQFFLGGSFLSLGGARGCGGVGIYLPALIALGLLFGVFLLLKSQLGTAFFIYGDNPLFLSNYAISTPFVFIVGVALAGGLAGVSGFLDVQAAGFVDMNMGAGRALFCITALVLGRAVASSVRRGGVVTPLAGVLLYYVLQQFLLRAGFDLRYFTMAQAFIVLLFLVIEYRGKETGKSPSVDNLGV
jgi:putative tryptophan/tyrosine transport system permease protein